jgi:hypothetical protein
VNKEASTTNSVIFSRFSFQYRIRKKYDGRLERFCGLGSQIPVWFSRNHTAKKDLKKNIETQKNSIKFKVLKMIQLPASLANNNLRHAQ